MLIKMLDSPKCCYPNCFNCACNDCICEQLTNDDIVRQNELDKEIFIERLDNKQRQIYYSNTKYNRSDKGKTRTQRYLKSNKGKIVTLNYEKSDKGKERQIRYDNSTKGKKRKTKYERKRLDLQWLKRYETLYKGTNKNNQKRMQKAYRIRNKYGIRQVL